MNEKTCKNCMNGCMFASEKCHCPCHAPAPQEEWRKELSRMVCHGCGGEGERYQACEDCGDCLQRCSECDGTGFEWDEGLYEKVSSLIERARREERKEAKEVFECCLCRKIHPDIDKEIQEAYDRGAMEATDVCNEKTIPFAVERVRRESFWAGYDAGVDKQIAQEHLSPKEANDLLSRLNSEE